MTGADSDNRYHPKEGEIGSNPVWVPFRRSMFSEGTIGYVVFPEILEGRLRPESIFDQKLTKVLKGNAVKQLEGRGLKTIGEVLKLKEEDLPELQKKGKTRERLRLFLEGKALLPHQKLLEALFGEKQEVVSAEREPEIIGAVEKGLKLIETVHTKGKERMIRVPELRFGLINGIPLTLKEVGRIYGIGGMRVSQIEGKALRILEHPSRRRYLKTVLSVPEQSLTGLALGVRLRGELEDLGGERVSSWG